MLNAQSSFRSPTDTQELQSAPEASLHYNYAQNTAQGVLFGRHPADRARAHVNILQGCSRPGMVVGHEPTAQAQAIMERGVQAGNRMPRTVARLKMPAPLRTSVIHDALISSIVFGCFNAKFWKVGSCRSPTGEQRPFAHSRARSLTVCRSLRF